MPTLVLPARYTDDSVALWRAALARGWDVQRLNSLRCDPAWPEPLLYLDTITAEAAAEQLGLRLVTPPLDWLCRLPFEYRRREVRALTWAQACAEPGPAFFKPADDKWFPARVYASGAAIEAPPEYDPQSPLLRAEPVSFAVEFRFFVADRRLRAGSVYSRDGELTPGWECSDEERERATELAERLLADPAVEFPRAAVLDVGLTREHGWAVVEANPAWASGIYGCDPEGVLDVLALAVA